MLHEIVFSGIGRVTDKILIDGPVFQLTNTAKKCIISIQTIPVSDFFEYLSFNIIIDLLITYSGGQCLTMWFMDHKRLD